MKRLRGATRVIVAALVFASAAAIAVGAEAKTPTQAYLDYRAALGKATTLTEILPHLSAAYRGMLESRPKDDQAVWLKRLKEDMMKDVQITKETITGDASVLAATGTSARGNAMKGKISLVKEGGSWKLDEQGWSTSGGNG